MEKNEKFNQVSRLISDWGFRTTTTDSARPWGGFFVIDESQSADFIDKFFPGTDKGTGKISPKILLVEPGKKLSWQYHHRRSEKWKVLEGPVNIIRSQSDYETDPHTLTEGEIVTLAKGERHRLVGLTNWGVIAEIWIHTDPSNPSNEEDIVRLNDDFGR